MVGLLQVLRKVTVSIRAVGVGTSGSSLSLSNQISPIFCDARAVVSEWQCSPIPRLISRGSSSSVATHRTEVAMGVWQVDGLNILLSCWQKPLSLNHVQHCIVWRRPFWVKKPDEVLCCWRLHRLPCLLPISTPNMLKQSSARETGCLKPRLLETYVELKDATL